MARVSVKFLIRDEAGQSAPSLSVDFPMPSDVAAVRAALAMRFWARDDRVVGATILPLTDAGDPITLETAQ